MWETLNLIVGQLPDEIESLRMGKVEQLVRASTFFDRLCTQIYGKVDAEGKGQVPVLKLTLAVPVLFQRFQSKLFDRLGEPRFAPPTGSQLPCTLTHPVAMHSHRHTDRVPHVPGDRKDPAGLRCQQGQADLPARVRRRRDPAARLCMGQRVAQLPAGLQHQHAGRGHRGAGPYSDPHG